MVRFDPSSAQSPCTSRWLPRSRRLSGDDEDGDCWIDDTDRLLGDDGSDEWSYTGLGLGSMGHQYELDNGGRTGAFSFPLNGGNITRYGIRLPSGADVTSASMVLTGHNESGPYPTSDQWRSWNHVTSLVLGA